MAEGGERLEEDLHPLLRDQLAEVADDRAVLLGQPPDPRRRLELGHVLVVAFEERVDRLRVPRVERPLDLDVEPRRASVPRRPVVLEQVRHLSEGLLPRSGPERRHVDTRWDHPDVRRGLRDQLRASPEHLRARADDGEGRLQSFASERPVPGLFPDRVFEIAAVDLRDVGTRSHGAAPDRGAGDPWPTIVTSGRCSAAAARSASTFARR